MPLHSRSVLPIRLTAILLASTAFSALPQMVQAQVAWDGSESDDWSDGDNWAGGAVPTAASAVVVDTTTNAPVIDDGDDFTISSLTIGEFATGIVTVGNGGNLTIAGTGGLGIGGFQNSGINGNGTLNVTGTGIVQTGRLDVAERDGSTGLLDISAGGLLSSTSLFAGTAAGSNATILVRGAGSTLDILSGAGGVRLGRSNLFSGDAGVAALIISDGGLVQYPGGVGWTVHQGSSIEVRGADGGGNASRLALPTALLMRGDLIVADGAEATINALTIAGTGTLGILDGGVLATSSAAPLGTLAGDNVSAVVSGAGARWTSIPTNAVLAIGNGATGIGQLEVLNGGLVDFNSTLTLGAGSALRVSGVDGAGVAALLRAVTGSNLAGDVTIENGGTAEFENLGIANGGTLTVRSGGLLEKTSTSTFSVAQQAQVLITGAGTVVNSVGGVGLINSTVGLAAADFVVEDGAVLNFTGTVGAGVSFSVGTLGENRNLIVRDGGRINGGGFNGTNGSVMIESGGQIITNDSWNLSGSNFLSITGGGRMDLLGASNPSFSEQTEVLISGADSVLNVTAALSINANNAGAADFVIADGAMVNVNSANQSGLAFGGERRLIVRDGATLNMTGGLLMNRGVLEATNATVNFSSGNLVMGSIFAGNTLTLINSDFTVGSISTNGGNSTVGNVINLGGTADGPASAVGAFNVGSIHLHGAGALTAEFNINHTNSDFDIASAIGGTNSNSIIRHLAGDTIFSGQFSGSNPYNGQTLVTGGTLRVNGGFGGGGHQMTVSDGAALGGSGVIVGTVTIEDGHLAPGNSPGTLIISGDLILGATSILDFELGSPSGTAGADSDLIEVSGTLTLDGTLNVIDAGGFGAGVYRLINVSRDVLDFSDITDNGLEIGAVPNGFAVGDLSIQVGFESAGENQIDDFVNLLVGSPTTSLNFWDGANFTDNGIVDGGAGTWTATGTNWTTDTGTPNSSYDPTELLIFMGQSGTVALDDSDGPIAIGVGMQFAVDGYVLTGSDLVLDETTSVVRVGDGTSTGAAFTATIASNITGDSALEKTDLGTLILTGANSYTGGTTVTDGTLIGNTDSLRGPIVTNATLVFDQAGEGSFLDIISGTGSLTKDGEGRLFLTGANTYTGGTTIVAGILAGNAGSLQGDIVNNAVLEFFQLGAGTYAGNISGSGALVKSGSVGILRLTGFNSYTGGTSVMVGGLQGDSDSLQGDIDLVLGQLIFDQGFDGAFAGSVTGNGSLTKTGGGVLTLTGASSFDGSTIIEGGELVAAVANLPGNASLAIENGATMRFVQDEDAVFEQTISGPGNLVKAGTGALTLAATGNGGEFNFTGVTDVVAGTLFLNGNMYGGIIGVGDGARLGGIGSTGFVTVNAGGALAPGNSIGTLTVTDITFEAGSIFEVELNDGGNGFGVNNDLLDVSGSATINGGTVHVTPENGTDDGSTYTPGTTYTIIRADGGASGTFDGVTDDYAFLDFALSYDPDNVFLTSALVGGSTGTDTGTCPAGLTFNQQASCGGVLSTGSGSLYTAVINLSNAEAPVALDQLLGEIHASTKTALIEDSRFPREAMLARLGTAGEGAGMWGQAFANWGQWDSDGNAGRMDRDISGLLTGIDAPLGKNARVGLMGGYSRSEFRIASRGSAGSASSWHFGAYAGGRWGRLGVKVGGAFAWHDMTTARDIAFTGFVDRADTTYKARTGQAFAEAGYRIEVGTAAFEPFANIAYVDLNVDGYGETGGAAALSGGSGSMDATFSTLGLRGEVGLGGKLRLTGSAGWRHAFGELSDRLPFTTHAFAGADDFTVAGMPIARNAVALDLGVGVALSDRANLSVNYNGQFGSALSDQGVKANLSIRF